MSDAVSRIGIQALADAALRAWQAEDFARVVVLGDDVLRLDPHHPGALHLQGDALRRLGEGDRALALLQRSLEIAPHYALAHKDLGVARLERGELEDAITSCRRAVELAPTDPHCQLSLGSALRHQGQLEDAIRAFRAALRIDPRFAAAHFNLAYCLLGQGRWEEGFEEYEWRLRLKGFPLPKLEPERPLWSQQAVRGRTLLLRAEQGHGDAIQFIRYAGLLAQRGARVVVQARPCLQRLIASAQGVTEAGVRGHVPEHDFQVPLLSLPQRLGTTPETIPADIPYLQGPDDALRHWRQRFATLPGLKVGVVWRTESVKPERFRDANLDKRRRSIELEALRPLLRQPGASFVSLQLEPSAAERRSLAQNRVLDVSESLSDFAETAAAVACLDLVVSIDTAIIHVAGALGRPVFTLLPCVADWRWLASRSETAWYPSMRLFRQHRTGSWEEPIQELLRALEERIRARHGRASLR